MTTIAHSALLGCLWVSSACGQQLYLLTGSPSQNYPETFASALLRVDRDGSVTETAELVPQSIGTEFIGISYDFRKAVILTNDGKNTILVVDFDSGGVSKKCSEPPVGIRLRAWLANPPAPGPLLEWLATGISEGVVESNVVQGMVLDASIPCEKSFTTLAPEDHRYFVAHGAAGIADVGSNDGPGNAVGMMAKEDTGRVYSVLGKRTPLEYEVPKALRSGIQIKAESVLINDSKVFALLLNGEKVYRILIFRKSDKTWRTLPISSELFPRIRGFGKYIAGLEIQKETESRRTPGTQRWRSEPGSRMGPNLGGRIGREVYSGRLYVYDVDTERVHSISTNQGDSEILLIEDNMVYYRAADEIYSAPITDRGIGRAHLLATGDAIRDAHWAFIKR